MNLDVNCLLTYNIPNLFRELFTLRSDDHRSKREVINNIISTGESTIPTKTGGGGSTALMDVFMLGLGLHIDSST